MSLTPEIIRLQPAEWPAYKQLRLEALEAEPQAFYDSLTVASQTPDEVWQRKLQEVRDGEKHIIFSKVEDELVGMACAEIRQKDREIGRAMISGVYVNVGFRGLGVATRMITQLITELRKNPGVKKIGLWVNTDSPALDFYQKLGFKIIDENSWTLADGQAHRGYLMELS